MIPHSCLNEIAKRIEDVVDLRQYDYIIIMVESKTGKVGATSTFAPDQLSDIYQQLASFDHNKAHKSVMPIEHKQPNGGRN